jgi:hypothetical protein
MATTHENVMGMSSAIAAIEICLRNNIPPLLSGAPGIGKSEIVELGLLPKFRAEYAERGQEFGFVNLHAMLKNPVDMLGLPVPDMEARETVWLRPSDLPIVGNDNKFPEFGLIFVDEIDKIPSAAMRALCLQLVLNRTVGEHVLKLGWMIVAAGNRQIDKTESQKLGTALDNRFWHVTINPEIGAFVSHAIGSVRGNAEMTRNVAYICAFLRAKPWFLHAMPGQELPIEAGTMRNALGQEVPIKLDSTRRAFPTPRGWLKYASKFISQPKAVRVGLVSGVVGHDIASEFEGFLLNVDKIATPSQIEADPDNCKLPEKSQLTAHFYAAGMLVSNVKRQNIAAFMTYAKRLGSEFYTMVGRDIGISKPDLCDTAAYAEWCVDTGEGVLNSQAA